MPEFSSVLSWLSERMNIFYLLAFAPLLVFAYYHTDWPFPIIIPIYGFTLLMIKKQDLELHPQPKKEQRALGLLVVFVSFFVYYGLILFFPGVPIYTSANYVIYIVGLCLVFFELSGLKEITSSIFLMVAGTSSSFISDWVRPYLSPYVTVQFAYLTNAILNSLGFEATVYSTSALSDPMMSFPSSQGTQIVVSFNWYCVGFSSLLIFSTILIILLIEDHGNPTSKLIWSIIGVCGILALNVLRVVLILVTDYFYGAEVGGTVHYVIGYALFIAWLIAFLYLFHRKTFQAST